MRQDRPRVSPCEHCGKELLWQLVPWPIETTPRHPDLCEARAYVIMRAGIGRYRAVDVRDLGPRVPDEVYPQHVCRVWRDKQAEASRDARRLGKVMERLTR